MSGGTLFVKKKKKGKGERCEVNIVFNKQTSVRELTLVWDGEGGNIKHNAHV